MIKRFFILLICAGLSACAQFTEYSVGLDNKRLSDCPASPRCVSSAEHLAEKRARAFYLVTPITANWQNVIAVVSRQDRTLIAKHEANYLHAEVTSPWGWYTDDLELLLDADSGRIDVRSSGRIGYYDFDVNRDRIESLRLTLASKGLIKPTH